MKDLDHRSLAKLIPRPKTIYCSQGRAVLATDLDGLICDFHRHGLFFGETRLLSRYRYFVDGKTPETVAVSNFEQHSWLGYYIFPPPGLIWKEDTGSGEMEAASEETVELRVSRAVGLGVHEDIDFTNFSQEPARFVFEIELDGDFADQAETFKRKQHGKLQRRWRRVSARRAELAYEYHAAHRYSHQGDRGVAYVHRGLIVQIENAGSPAVYRDSRLRFEVRLSPRKSWHTCIKFIPVFEGKKMQPLYDCRQFFGTHNELDRKRSIFLSDSTQFDTNVGGTLATVVGSALHQAKRDLAALRLPDLDHGDQGWVMAAGLPIYIALFGRDTLTAGWQAPIASTSMMSGALYELPKWQGKVENDWRDEQPGRMLHEAHTGPLAALNYNPRSRYYGAATTSSFYPVVLSELWHWTGNKGLVQPLLKPALLGLRWKDKYTDRFGMPEEKFFALGLDAKRRQIRSISSNPGHLLACGIVHKDLAASVARRLLRDDMFSGWGVRTLSSEHPAYDPYSYHRGSVWPVEHGTFAMGMMRFGLIDELHRIARAIFEVSDLFDYNRLPECLSGHPRDADHPFPALYPKTNWPQAWSASSLFSIMQAILGIYPYAPMNILFLDPHLPDWLPEITLRNLHVGMATVDIGFYRKGKTTHFDVLDKRGKLHILRQPSPWSLTAGFAERFKDVMESLIP